MRCSIGLGFLILLVGGLALGEGPFQKQDPRALLRGSAEPFTALEVPQQAFWRSRPSIVEQLRDEDEIVVSVLHQQGEDGSRLEMKGAGWIRTPGEFAFRTAKEFSRLKEVSSHFRQVEYSATSHRLFVQTEAMGWYATMVQQIQYVQEGGKFVISWHNIAGSFKGMKGTIEIRNVAEQRCEMSLVATYRAPDLPIPAVLLNLGLEFVIKRAASSMRQYIEKQYRAQPTVQAPVLEPPDGSSKKGIGAEMDQN